MIDTVPAATVRVGALERTVDIEVPSGAVLARIRKQWARCLVTLPSSEPAAGSVSYPADSEEDLGEYTVVSAVTRRFIEARAGELTMLHAAGIADLETGSVTALVASSGTGKTTAARRLCAADFGYVTDETVAVRLDRTVLPYPKPLSIITEGEIHKRQHGPDELGLKKAPADLNLTRIVVLEREGKDGERPTVEPVALLDGILTLIPQLSYLTKMTDSLISLVRLVQACGGVQRLTYTDIEQCADELRALAAASPTEDADVDHLGYLADPLPKPPAADTVRRGAYLDGVRIDDELLLLVGNHPIRCSGLGATVWLALDTPRTVAELVTICKDLHGPHPDAAALVRAAIQELTDHQVVWTD